MSIPPGWWHRRLRNRDGSARSVAWLRLRVFALAAAAQSIAAIVLLTVAGAADSWPHAPAAVLAAAAAQGAFAAACGHALGLPRWWLPINGLLPVLAAALLLLAIDPAWYLGAFAAGFLIFGTGPLRSGAALYPSPPAAAEALAALIDGNRAVRVLDAGCGTGTLLVALSRLRPRALLHGIECAFASWAIARLRALRAGGAIRVCRGDFWSCDSGAYDVVYVFLSTAPMRPLWEKVRREMRPGSLLVSLNFAVPEVPPARVIELNDGAGRLYLWQL